MLSGAHRPCMRQQHQQPWPQQHKAHSQRWHPTRCMSLQVQQTAQMQPAEQLLASMLDCHLQDLELQQHMTAAVSSCCTATEHLLDTIYDNIDDVFYSKGGFIIPKREKQHIDATGGSASYGEIEAAGVDVLLRHLAMDSSSTFVDLGCGRGRAVLQVALHSPVAKAIGLELSESRLEQAGMALQQLQQQQQQQQGQQQQLRPVEFRQADLSSCSFDEGTHFYLCSTAFGAAICRSIAERLQASPSFQALVTSRQLPSQPHLYKLDEVPCSYSFNANGRAYIYVKSLNPAVAPAAVLSRLWCRDGVCWLPGLSGQQLGPSVDEPLDAAAARQFVQLTTRSTSSSRNGSTNGQQTAAPASSASSAPSTSTSSSGNGSASGSRTVSSSNNGDHPQQADGVQPYLED